MTTKVKAPAESVVLLPPKDRTYLAEQLLASLGQRSIWSGNGLTRLNVAATKCGLAGSSLSLPKWSIVELPTSLA